MFRECGLVTMVGGVGWFPAVLVLGLNIGFWASWVLVCVNDV